MDKKEIEEIIEKHKMEILKKTKDDIDKYDFDNNQTNTMLSQRYLRWNAETILKNYEGYSLYLSGEIEEITDLCISDLEKYLEMNIEDYCMLKQIEKRYKNSYLQDNK